MVKALSNVMMQPFENLEAEAQAIAEYFAPLWLGNQERENYTSDSFSFGNGLDITASRYSPEVAPDVYYGKAEWKSGKIHTAAAAAYALSQVLDRLSINHEVICFTTGDVHDGSRMEEQERKYGVKYSRYESLYMPIVKGYEERINTETRQRFAWLPNVGFLRNNVDGECIDIAHRRLRMRKEKGKIMIVLSDGCPHAQSGTGRGSLSRHLKDTVEGIERSGTKIIGIGINSSEVKNFYTKNVVINNVEELPQGVIRELRTMLMAK